MRGGGEDGGKYLLHPSNFWKIAFPRTIILCFCHKPKQKTEFCFQGDKHERFQVGKKVSQPMKNTKHAGVTIWPEVWQFYIGSDEKKTSKKYPLQVHFKLLGTVNHKRFLIQHKLKRITFHTDYSLSLKLQHYIFWSMNSFCKEDIICLKWLIPVFTMLRNRRF